MVFLLCSLEVQSNCDPLWKKTCDRICKHCPLWKQWEHKTAPDRQVSQTLERKETYLLEHSIQISVDIGLTLQIKFEPDGNAEGVHSGDLKGKG